MTWKFTKWTTWTCSWITPRSASTKHGAWLTVSLTLTNQLQSRSRRGQFRRWWLNPESWRYLKVNFQLNTNRISSPEVLKSIKVAKSAAIWFDMVMPSDRADSLLMLNSRWHSIWAWASTIGSFSAVESSSTVVVDVSVSSLTLYNYLNEDHFM